MNIYFELIAFSLIIGIGATVIMDIYAIVLKRLFNIPSLDYALLGRWIGHFKNGIFFHKTIIQAEKIRYERTIGWIAHYSIGISFACLLLLIWGTGWAYHPTLLPALAIGILTTVAPFFLMQPAFGFGIAAAKTPHPAIARFRSLKTHTIYGIGLYLAALLLSRVMA
ncbi:DUF2938 domain-containing protein [Chitinophaga nivalis]|uniref:DUF2938 domain-containing protein n=1 Tax=Chitinophaga nivalis TaxID=2991709 RepID=A0ABT3IPS0_9BACT|nr:DUF2938 domain-containing protein [Chitinophaga nivalis]MCW3464367.1 DUF2938 domain-containing protein [Chitinophaga nivalis]MCW3485942.1 DUF2938 domain-containing protein [Chitinophaga nivalis]